MPSVSSIAYNPSLAACWMRSSSFIFPSSRVVADREGAAQAAPECRFDSTALFEILSASHSSASLRIACGPAGWPSFGREGNGESLGQLGGASLSNCRELRAEGESTRSLTATSSENTTSCQNGIVSQRTNANEAARRRFLRALACQNSGSRLIHRSSSLGSPEQFTPKAQGFSLQFEIVRMRERPP